MVGVVPSNNAYRSKRSKAIKFTQAVWTLAHLWSKFAVRVDSNRCFDTTASQEQLSLWSAKERGLRRQERGPWSEGHHRHGCR